MRYCVHFKTATSVLISAALFTVAISCPAADENAEKVIAKAFTVEPGGSVSVEADQGDIQLLTGKQNAVEVVVEREVTGVSDSQAAKILKKHKVTASLEGNAVYVEAKSPKSARDATSVRQPELTVHIRITVPKRFDSRLNTEGGNIEATGLEGAVDAKTSGGDLSFTNIHGLVNGQTSGGNIRVLGCSKKLVVHTAGGNLVINDYTGPGLQADSGGGNINVTNCTGAMAVKTSGGNIDVANFNGPQAYADTAGGSVYLELEGALLADSWVRSGGGNVKVTVADGVSANLTATTDGGTIDTEIAVSETPKGRVRENRLEGKINGGGPKLQVKTSGGNIDIWKK